MDEQQNISPVNEAASQIPQELPLAGAMLRDAWNYYKTHAARLIAIGIAPFIVSVAFFAANYANTATVFLISLLSSVVGILSSNAFVYAVAEESTSETVGSLYSRGAQAFFSIIWASILAFVATMGGIVLLIVPGIIVGIYLTFVRYAVLLEGRRGSDALAASWYYARQYAGKIFWRALVFGVSMGIVSIIASIIGKAIFPGALPPPSDEIQMLFDQKTSPGLDQIFVYFLSYCIIAPLSTYYFYLLYRALQGMKGNFDPESEEGKKIHSKIVYLYAIAIIGVLLLIVFAGAVIALMAKTLIESGKLPTPSAMSGADAVSAFAQAIGIYR